jgi:hypothetical protein
MERKVPNMKEPTPAHKMVHDHVKQHAAGHQYEQEKVEAMCKGGKA